MSEEKKKSIRLANVAKELNVGIGTIVEHLAQKGHDIENKPTAKLTEEMYGLLLSDYQVDKQAKEASHKINIGTERKAIGNIDIEDVKKPKETKREREQEEVLIKNIMNFNVSTETIPDTNPNAAESNEVLTQKEVGVKIVGKIDLSVIEKKKSKKSDEEIKEHIKPEDDQSIEPKKEITTTENAADIKVFEEDIIKASSEKLQGPTIVGKIDLPERKKKIKLVASSGNDEYEGKRKKRKRKKKSNVINVGVETSLFTRDSRRPKFKKSRKSQPTQVTEKEVQDQIKETLSRLSVSTKSKSSKHRKLKREEASIAREKELEEQEAQKNIIQVTEFSTVNELSSLMNVSVNEIISSCMELGILVSINQRLDAETMTVVADEFGYKVNFVSADEQETIIEEETDTQESLTQRPPIVTVMGHVDHGKTSLLDYIRKTNVIAGEAGGITQHIGAYEVKLENGKLITFIDTPGHEAFTAMRARGAKVTDIAVIIVAADDSVMPQTLEAINHAQAAGVPMVFAINKIDKEGANVDTIKEQLSHHKILVEDWGGNYQCQPISAKKGQNVDLLLDRILLQSDYLNLKANPNKRAIGTVIEATMEKGKGIVTTLLVQNGTLKIGDVMVAGCFYGKIKAMFNERGGKVVEAGPSCPVQVLGFSGSPQAGDKFYVLESEQEAKEIANKRLQLQREQGLRTHKHITLDEVGRRLAIGSFKELNLIVKGDVDGSVEALSDSLLKLSTQEVQINIIHKSVGQIIDSDVMLASASDAVIVGFQVRPSVSARKLAEAEQIDIRLYSVIYNAIEEIKSALEGMLEPTVEEKITCNLEVREVFKITKVGTIAGCYVTDGKIIRNSKTRVIRDGVVVYSGTLSSLKRFKEDVKEVTSGYECGLSIENFNDIKAGDVVEGFELTEVKKTLA